MAAHTTLADKLDDLFNDCVARHVYAEASQRIAGVAAAPSTPGVQMMLRKGRQLTEKALDACQMKRTKTADVSVELKHLAAQLVNWKVLGLEVGWAEFGAMVLFAKQQCAHLSPQYQWPESKRLA